MTRLRGVTMKKQYILIISLLLAFLLAFSGCAAKSTANTPAMPAASAPAVTPPAPAAALPPTTLAGIETTLENVYAQVNPSVVNIRVVQKQTTTLPNFPQIPGFPFPTPQQPQPFYSQGLGSGFIWDREGHIVTNNHVIAGADNISVTLYDGTTVPGKVVGADPDSDLAVVAADIPAAQLNPVQMADSTQVKVGQLAIAIGNPFGLQGTMTVGFVSALGRLLPADSSTTGGLTYSIPDVIQTDAPINPGNSGGVLLDSTGRVIGVTSAIVSSAGSSAGIGFAIPSAIVQKVVPALIKTGTYQHPWLGVSGLSLNPDIAQAMGLPPEQRGALIEDVVPNGPADKAGLKGSTREVTIYGESLRVDGDVITAINGQAVKSFDDLVTYLARATDIGQTVTLTVLSAGKEKEVKVTLAVRPATPTSGGQASASTTGGAWLGIYAMTVNAGIAGAMGLPPDQKGVLVEQVQPGSPAEEAGLRGSDRSVSINGQSLMVGGDIIIGLDNQSVGDMDTLQSLLQMKKPGDRVTLKILRAGSMTELEVTLGERPASAR